VSEAPTTTVAPPWLRGVARAVDWLAGAAVLEAAFALTPWLPVRGLVTVGDEVLLGLDIATGLFTVWLAPTLSETLSGATVGKTLLGLRTVRAVDGAPPSAPAAAWRNLLVFLDVPLFGMVSYSEMARSPRRQRSIDARYEVEVVRARDARQPTAALWGVPAGLAAALAFVLLSYVVTG